MSNTTDTTVEAMATEEKSIKSICESGNIEVVKNFIRSKSESNKLYRYPINALYYAFKSGNVEVIELIAEMCVQTNDTNDPCMKEIWRYGLQGACRCGHVDIFKRYITKISRSCDYTWRDYMVSFFKNAGMSGNLELIDFVINQYGNGNKRLLNHDEVYKILKGARKGHHAELIELMTAKCENFQNYFKMYKYLGFVCEKGQVEILKFIVKNEWIDEDEWDLDWDYGLKKAYCGGNLEIINIIMENVNPKYGLITACRSGNLKYVEQMIEHISKLPKESGDSVNWDNGLTAACKSGNIVIIELVISKGAKDWNEGFDGACEEKHVEIAKLMLTYGVSELESRLYIACKYGSVEILELVIQWSKEKRVDINFNTVLNHFWEMRHIKNRIEIITILIENGATFGGHILRMACFDGDIELTQLIFRYNINTWNIDDLTFILNSSTQYIWRDINNNGGFYKVLSLLISKGAKITDRRFFQTTVNFQLYRAYCKYDNINPLTDKKYLKLLKTYPPYVFMEVSRLNKNICTSKLPTELYRLLFMY